MRTLELENVIPQEFQDLFGKDLVVNNAAHVAYEPYAKPLVFGAGKPFQGGCNFGVNPSPELSPFNTGIVNFRFVLSFDSGLSEIKFVAD